MTTAAPPSRREVAAVAEPPRRPVYVFELPVRIVHWTIVLALIVLSVTGYYIHHPFLGGSGTVGHPGFTMGEMRFIHEATGFGFIAAFLVRVYWAFAGNRYAHWRGLLPVGEAGRRGLFETLQFYSFLRRHPWRTHGHTPLAGLAYVALYLCFLVSILTGLGLYAWVIRTPPWTTLFGWTTAVTPVQSVRLVHFLLMFVYGAFTVHHVYSAVLFDRVERNGELSSIVTGYKADVEDCPAHGDPRTEH